MVAHATAAGSWSADRAYTLRAGATSNSDNRLLGFQARVPPMVFLRAVARSGVVIVLSTSTLHAQGRRAAVIVAPLGQPRIATIAPTPRSARQPVDAPTVFADYPGIVTADGRILVNMGTGYEEVARTCPHAYGYQCQSSGYPPAPLTPLSQEYIPPSYAVPRYAPPVYSAPVYAEPRDDDGSGYARAATDSPMAASSVYACPAGWLATESYPACIDPTRVARREARMRPRGVMHAAPRTVPAHGGPGPRLLTPRR